MGAPEVIERRNAEYLKTLLAELDSCSMEDAERYYMQVEPGRKGT